MFGGGRVKGRKTWEDIQEKLFAGSPEMKYKSENGFGKGVSGNLDKRSTVNRWE